MRLIELRLENFQGIQSATFRFDGHDAAIYGDNATGKTTVFNAVTWLLFDRPSTGAKGYTPKTRIDDQEAHYLDHAVEATIDAGGRQLQLRKVYHEVYKKQRGSIEERFSGHTTDHYIDGVPVQEREYQTTVQALGGTTEQMRMLTMPDYFAEQLPWEQRRQILLEICGDITDQQIIDATPDLAGLPTVLAVPGKSDALYSVDEYRKIAAAKKAEINRELQTIPQRIDEAQRAIPVTTGMDAAAIAATITQLQGQRQTLEDDRAQARSGNTTAAAIRTSIADAQARLAEARAQHTEQTAQVNATAQQDIQRLQTAQFEHVQIAKTLTSEAAQVQASIDRMQAARAALLQEYRAIQAEQFGADAEDCPTCHRRLPEEHIADLRAAFNERRSERLQTINQRGTTEASQQMIDGAVERQARLNEMIAESNHEAERLATEIEIKRSTVVAAEPFENTTIYSQITLEMESLRNNADNAGTAQQAEVQRITTAIAEVDSQIEHQNAMMAALRLASSQTARIEELKQQEKNLAGQYERLEHGLYLCEQFVQAKVRLLTDRINDRFQNVRFRLFIEQVNGGIRDDCEVLVPSQDGTLVPYATANNAGRINAGLEMIDTLGQHWGLQMPVFVDNAESVVRLRRIDAQVIRLVVSGSDATLRLEQEVG